MSGRYLAIAIGLVLAIAVIVYGFSLAKLPSAPKDPETIADENRVSPPKNRQGYDGAFQKDQRDDAGIMDPRIASVTSDAQNIVFSRFPEGLFSADDSEHGLINYVDAPVAVLIQFKEPVKLSAISNIFTHCSTTPPCYTWSAIAMRGDGSADILVSGVGTNSDIESRAEISSPQSLHSLKIVVTRTGGTDGYVHWKKIKLEYK